MAIQMDMASAGLSEGGSFASPDMKIDRLLATETHLGLIRELVPPQDHIALKFFPFMEVETDDVILDYLKDTGSGLAPAVSPDAESELFQDNEDITGQIRASVVDWRLKSRYTWTDVGSYREAKAIVEEAARQGGTLPLTAGSQVQRFARKISRDTERRKRWLDNRIEWMGLNALSTGKISYNDGKLLWDTDFGRPADQQAQTPTSGVYTGTTHDPINDIIDEKQKMFDRHGVDVDRMIVSRKYANSLVKSAKFLPRTGFAPGTNVDPRYVLEGWGPQAAIDIVKRECDVDLIINDNVHRQRNMVTGAVTNVRYIPENRVIFLPNEAQLAAYDDTELGFGKFLTSPHPMNAFQPGWYGWENTTSDPWIHVVGTGIKTYPCIPHMELTSSWDVTL